MVSLLPADKEASGHEFDEDNVEFYHGDRDVLAIAPEQGEEFEQPAAVEQMSANKPQPGKVVSTSAAPKPVGAYPHARRVGNLLYSLVSDLDSLAPMPFLEGPSKMPMVLVTMMLQRKPERSSRTFELFLRLLGHHSTTLSMSLHLFD